MEELECELEPLVTQAAGTTNVSLLITNTPAGKHFRVDGSSVREGFSFMVSLHCSVFALCQWEAQEGWTWNEMFHFHILLGTTADINKT